MSTRRDISMAPVEIEQFLGDQTTIIAIAGDDLTGPPLGAVARVVYADGALEVELAGRDPLVAALAADPRICLIAEQAPSYYEIKAVIVRGTAEMVHESAERATYRVATDTHTSFDFGRLRTPPQDR